MADCGAHEEVKEHKAAKSKNDLKKAADERIKLQETAKRPPRRPGSADDFGPDENGHGGKGRNVEPVDFLCLSQNSSRSILADAPGSRGLPEKILCKTYH